MMSWLRSHVLDTRTGACLQTSVPQPRLPAFGKTARKI